MFEKLELAYWEARLKKEPNNEQIKSNIELLKKKIDIILNNK